MRKSRHRRDLPLTLSHMPRPIELLSPARNLECGIEAIRHGADAVYIGAPRFGARAAAGNSVEDIARLVDFARPFGVRIYVTLNTLLRDDELPAAQALINDLAAVGVTALIVQDTRILPSTVPASTIPAPSCPSQSAIVPAPSTPSQSATIPAPSSPLQSTTIPAPSRLSQSDSRVAHIFVRSPLPLHSSTQMDNRTVEDVRARLAAGYQQTVLARELSLEEIRAIHAAVPEMPLEVFIHGALCVSYSGRCYASEYCFNRSANRGECAQFCRLPFDLVDAEGHIIAVPESPPSATVPKASRPVTVPEGSPEGLPLRQRHLLSLRDMNRAADLEAQMDAGATSFKIEGRLKDVSYVKNITAYYRQRIDAIISRRPNDFCRASRGVSTISFTPNPLKSFNRGFTDYFLHTGTSAATPATAPLHQHLTPKSLGEPIGTVKEIDNRVPVKASHLPAANNRFNNTGRVRRSLAATAPSFTLSGTIPINNGDGLCFFTPDGHLQGFRINRVDEQGHLYPADPAIFNLLRRGTPLFRNQDAAFERQLSRPTAERRIPVRWLLEDSTVATPPETSEGFRLTISTTASHPVRASRFFPLSLEPARTPQTENLRRQLLRLGDTPFSTTEADITLHLTDNWFIPASTLADWRRQLTEELLMNLTQLSPTERKLSSTQIHPAPLPHGQEPEKETPLMTCRYCLRQALGLCTKTPASSPTASPWFLRLSDGRRFPLRFDCKNCLMYVLAPDA